MIRLFTAGDESAWDAFVLARPGARSCHTLAWKRVIESALGQRTYYLLSVDRYGEVDGVMPMARLRSWLFGDFVASLPYLNYGGPCAANPTATRDLIDAATRMAQEMGVQHLEVRMETPEDVGLTVRSTKVSMRLALPESADALWKCFPSKLRSQVKRAENESMTVCFGRGEGELTAFYQVFAENMRDLGTPVYGKRFFRAVLAEIPDSRVCCVSLRGTPVAAGLIVGFRDMLEIPWASALRRFNRLSPNMLLYWSVLKFGCERGYRVFDFGRSSPDSGTFRFKAQWDAQPVPLYWHYWVPDGKALPDLTPKNPKMQAAIRAWRHLPVAVTKVIGPRIVRNLP